MERTSGKSAANSIQVKSFNAYIENCRWCFHTRLLILTYLLSLHTLTISIYKDPHETASLTKLKAELTNKSILSTNQRTTSGLKQSTCSTCIYYWVVAVTVGLQISCCLCIHETTRKQHIHTQGYCHLWLLFQRCAQSI